jgi:poly(3-hydroxybutyrate) depolymerase
MKAGEFEPSRVALPTRSGRFGSAAVSETSRSNVGDSPGLFGFQALADRKRLRLVPKTGHSRVPARFRVRAKKRVDSALWRFLSSIPATVALLGALLCGCSTSSVRRPLSSEQLAEATRLSRAYLDCSDAKEKETIAKGLALYDRAWEEVVAALRSKVHAPVKAGFHPAEHFRKPRLRAKHPEDLLYFAVPSSYDPGRPSALVVFMHGGGKGSPRTAPAGYMTPATARDSPNGSHMGEIFEQAGMIGVAPSAPWNENDNSRWCLPESDDYVADVIEDCRVRFAIDSDRVFLMGHSMGGFGAFQMAQTQPDRFAGIVAVSGSWTLAHWPSLRGTDFCIVHGVKDAERNVRDRHTDVSFSRWADRMLTDAGVPHHCLEHEGGHGFGHSKPQVLEYLRSADDVRRDPFFPKVSLTTPAGHHVSRLRPVHHRRWLTLAAAADGEVDYEGVRIQGGKGHSRNSAPEDWDRWRLERIPVRRKGARIEAEHLGGNRFAVTTTHVARFTLWLHPKMVDPDRKITVTVNGDTHRLEAAAPSLRTALDAFERRRDWGMIYPGRLTIEVRDGAG